MEGIKEKKVRAYDTDIALEIHADQNRLSYTEIKEQTEKGKIK